LVGKKAEQGAPRRAGKRERRRRRQKRRRKKSADKTSLVSRMSNRRRLGRLSNPISREGRTKGKEERKRLVVVVQGLDL